MHGALTDPVDRFPHPFHLVVREETDSTNDEARRFAAEGAAHGLVVMARKQTKGRGRRGATWFSDPDASLTFSVLLRPTQPKALWPRFALAAGVAVAEATEAFGARPSVKWPNDVWIHGRKLAGILVEAGQDHVVTGIGINVRDAAMPPDLARTTTSLASSCGRDADPQEVLDEVIRRLATRLAMIEDAFSSVVRAANERCALTGHRVRLDCHRGSLEGTVRGIAPGGELLLETETGMETLLQADSIRIINPALDTQG
jgi:BirA family biotin operon repressor/biotin-[acetyl-CoA-carboxylase] ligase